MKEASAIQILLRKLRAGSAERERARQRCVLPMRRRAAANLVVLLTAPLSSSAHRLFTPLGVQGIRCGAPIAGAAVAELQRTQPTDLELSESSTTHEINAFITRHGLSVPSEGREKRAILRDISLALRVRSFDYSSVAEGKLFVGTGWLSGEMLRELRSDAHALLRSGEFDDMDEPIGKRLKRELYRTDWAYGAESEPSDARGAAKQLFGALRVELERVLQRRLFLEQPGAQVKYSVAKAGEPLCWHVDQLHEAFDLQTDAVSDGGVHRMRTRRGLSWLLYLSDDGWDEPGGGGEGGTLRAYPRADCVGRCGTHDGNVQVGWLERGGHGSDRGSEAVYLDCWGVPPEMEGTTLAELRRESDGILDEETLWSELVKRQPQYRLYRVSSDGRRENLSEAHRSPERDPVHGTRLGRMPTLREMLPPELRDGFSSTLCRAHPMQQPVDVSPKGGTLVIFDPVAVPHEVLPVLRGERVALFGFMAEERKVPHTWVDEPPDGKTWALDGWAHTDDAD